MRIFNLFPITPRDLTCIPVNLAHLLTVLKTKKRATYVTRFLATTYSLAHV